MQQNIYNLIIQAVKHLFDFKKKLSLGKKYWKQMNDGGKAVFNINSKKTAEKNIRE